MSNRSNIGGVREMRVLICAPVRQTEEIFQLYLDGLNNLEIPSGVEVEKFFVLHNSQHLSKYLDESEYKIVNDNTQYNFNQESHKWKTQNLLALITIKNQLIQYALLNNFDYYFLVDSDLILHPKTLVSLLNADKDIVAEVFWTRWKTEFEPEPNAWDLDHYTIYDNSIKKWKNPGVYRVGMTGACKLVKRNVLESGVNYDPIYNLSFWGEDRHFCIRAVCVGFDIWLDTHFPCKHIYRGKDLQEFKEANK